MLPFTPCRPGRITSFFLGSVATEPTPYPELSSELGYDVQGTRHVAAGGRFVVWDEKHNSINQTLIRAFDTAQMSMKRLKLDATSSQQLQPPTLSRFKPSACGAHIMYQQ